MKIICNIPILAEAARNCELVVEAGDKGISFLWFIASEKSVKGIVVINFDEEEQADDCILRSLQIRNDLIEPVRNFHCFFNFKDFLLTPQKYKSDNHQSALFNMMFGSLPGPSICHSDPSHNDEFQSFYRLPESLSNLLIKKNNQSRVLHSNTALIDKVQDEHVLYCNIFYNNIKVLLRKNSEIRLIQQYQFDTPLDAAYLLLNICHLNEADPSEVKLRVCGMIAQDSQLYEQLYNFFLDIGFREANGGYTLDESLKGQPAHFFTHLIELAECVS